MIIDCHTHIGINKHINASVEDLLISMDKAEIDQALVYAAPIAGIENEDLVKAISKHRNRLHPVFACGPYIGPIHILDIAKNEGAVGIKFYTGYDHYEPYDVYRHIEHLSDLNIPMIFHMGDTLKSVKSARLRYAQPLVIDDIASDYPEITFVIAHMGYPWHIDTAAVCHKNDNVYTDISGFVYGSFKDSEIELFNKTITDFVNITESYDKLLFGTDFPISNQLSYINSINKFMDVNILTNNVRKVFRL